MNEDRAILIALKEQQEVLKSKQDAMDLRLARVEGDVSVLKRDVSQVKEDVSDIKESLTEIKGYMARTEEERGVTHQILRSIVDTQVNQQSLLELLSSRSLAQEAEIKQLKLAK